eukprot:7847414-Lingulodinium_polyedra.AAC.1
MFFIVCVARPVGKVELEREEKARAARGQERGRLRAKRVSGEDHPREWDEVRAEAHRNHID